MTKENAEKKRYLSRYRWTKQRLAEIDEEIAGCRMDALPGGISYDGMPHGSGSLTDLSDYAVKFDRLLTQRIRIKTEAAAELNEISEAIEEVEDIQCRTLLRYRYILLLGWEEISKKMNYSEVHVRKYLHGKALREFVIP